ncbi:hypothetical protein OSTOST_06388 [Ostertagia ostertagi]
MENFMPDRTPASKALNYHRATVKLLGILERSQFGEAANVIESLLKVVVIPTTRVMNWRKFLENVGQKAPYYYYCSADILPGNRMLCLSVCPPGTRPTNKNSLPNDLGLIEGNISMLQASLGEQSGEIKKKNCRNQQ